MICKTCAAPTSVEWLRDGGNPECAICGGPLKLEVRDLLGEGNLLGYAMREPQFEMATHVQTLLDAGCAHGAEIKAWCLKESGRPHDPNWSRYRSRAIDRLGSFEPLSGIIEASTGTGKTLAYLVPAVANSGHRIVIATANKALQKQILDEDGPALCNAVAGVLPRPKIVVKKGKSNYVCLAAARTLPQAKDDLERLTQDPSLQDIDTMDPVLPWARNASVSACGGSACKFAASCLYLQNKQDLETADVIVTNQHSLALEYALHFRTGGNVSELLFGERSGVIIDEAHNFADVVRSQFASSHRLDRVEERLEDWGFHGAAHAVRQLHNYLSRERPSAPVVLDETDAHIMVTTRQLIQDTVDALDDALRVANQNDTQAWSNWRAAREGGYSDGKTVDEAFEDVREAQAISRGVGDYRSAFENASHLEHSAAWFSQDNGAWRFEVAPIHIQPILREFWKQYPVILTSATISSGNTFTQFRRKLGIHRIPPENELIVGSPFDYASRTSMYYTADPRFEKPGRYTKNDRGQRVRRTAIEMELALQDYYDVMAAEICEWLALTGGRAMVLFASRADMDAFWARMARHQNVAHLDFLVQSPETPASMLAEKFMALAKSQIHLRPRQGPVMLGLASIWEGISIKYDHLVNVIIPRVPFLNNNDPVHQRLEHSLAQRYLENGVEPKRIGRLIFEDLQVYEASIKMRQGTGRLIRTTKDAGICVLLDYRLSCKSYGRSILKDLSAGVNRTTDKQLVQRHFQQIDAALTAMRDRS